MAEHDERRGTTTSATRRADRDAGEIEPGADREPTAGEERAAETAREELESEGRTDEIAAHHREMDELGAHQQGEGRLP